MNRSMLLPAAYLADQIAGDPEWLPHPVRLIGLAISRGETALRRSNQTDAAESAAGALLTIAIVGSAYGLTNLSIHAVRRRSKALGHAAELLLAWTCLAAKNLEQEASAVTHALECGNLPFARHRLARIVGRDTDQLSEAEVSRAVIETVAESASDGIMAPMFYMALGGVPLAMAYKAINTLDSMIGHADSRYFYFGKVAARLDDAANFLPARLTALAVVAASHWTEQSDPQSAWKTWQRDGAKHKSPNAGQPESAMAGALQVALGGDNIYAGERVAAQRMGQGFPAPTANKARQAIRIVSTASILGLGAAVLLAMLMRAERRG